MSDFKKNPSRLKELLQRERNQKNIKEAVSETATSMLKYNVPIWDAKKLKKKIEVNRELFPSLQLIR